MLAEGAADGDLAGTTFVAKDLYDVAGYPTGAGNPQWEATHPVPTTTSSAVTRLLAAGATLIGKSHTDELAYSLSGTNVHYGTPVNSAAPGCVPGGSSSGSASAVAGGLCDFALGSDTGGSVRVPASFCGIFGLRPTHGRVAADGVVPLAPSFDAVGWFANSGAVLMQVGRVLLDTDFDETAHLAATKLVLADDLLAAVPDEVATVVEAAARARGHSSRLAARARFSRRRRHRLVGRLLPHAPTRRGMGMPWRLDHRHATVVRPGHRAAFR